MLGKLSLSIILFVIAVASFLGVTWLAWPSAEMLAPEKTGEIGFMGVVLVAKYAGYTLRLLAAVGLGAAAFYGSLVLGFLTVDSFLHREPSSPATVFESDDGDRYKTK